jgi:hypothetical protein
MQKESTDLGPINQNDTGMQTIEPVPMQEPEETERILTSELLDGLPAVPDSPVKPAEPNLDQYGDKDTRKQVEREHRRQLKTYEQAVKDRNRAMREREKIVEKRRNKAQQRLSGNWKEEDGRSISSISSIKSDDLTKSQQDHLPAPQQQQEEKKKKKKRKKFCRLPSKVNGVNDPTWVDVYMDGMDEVGAHCGLFFSGPHYDKLVGDVASRVIGWVQDDMTKRAILELHEGGVL